MRFHQHLYRIMALFVIIMLFAGMLFHLLTPQAGHATTAGNNVLAWPFLQTDGPWSISSGYNDSHSPDHNCNYPNNLYNCYERYALNLAVASGSTGGKAILSPATGTVIGTWPAYSSNNSSGGQCFTISLGNSTYVMVCHIDFSSGTIPSTVTQGQQVGTVNVNANAIQISLFTSSSDSTALNPSKRYPLPFLNPWEIGGCNYPNDPANTPTPGGQYNALQVPDAAHCSPAGTAPTLTIQWGSTSSSLWNGINLNRPVLIEVRDGENSPDLFNQVVTTDATGAATFPLTGIIPGSYNVYIKPAGFLRQEAQPSPVNLVAGTNMLTFSMTNAGIRCDNGQSTGDQLWIGDVNGDNVINSEDYAAIVKYNGQSPPLHYADLDGDGIIDELDYNLWLNSICFFGGGQGDVVGDGGREDSPIGQTVPHSTSTRRILHASPVTGVEPSTTNIGIMRLLPAGGSYRIGQSFNMNVQVDSGGLLVDGADAVILYDPTVLEVNLLTPGTIFPTTVALTNNPTKGEISISGIIKQNHPLSVSGTLATIQFNVIGSGQTSVTLDFNPTSTARSGMLQDSTMAQVLGTVNSASYTLGILQVPHDYSTIAQALAAAQPRETVLVAPGTYNESFAVPANVTLKGQDAATTIIDGGGKPGQPVISLDAGATISDLTVQHSGTGATDAAIWAGEGPVTITNNLVLNSSMGIVRFCNVSPCADTSIISNNLVAHNLNVGIMIHGALADIENNTVVNNNFEGIDIEGTGGQGTIVANILVGNQTAITATTSTTLARNLLWQNATNYNPSSIAGLDDITTDPLFLNPSTNDYRLHAVSAAFGADGSLGAYPFIPAAAPVTNLTATQSSQGVTLSWQGTSAAGYYVSVAQDPGFFSQPIDIGNVTSYTLSASSLPTGVVQIAVSSYDSQHQENLLALLPAIHLSSPTGGGSGTGSTTISKTWYFAEGKVGGGFTEWLTIENPDPVNDCAVTIQYLLSNGSSPVTRSGIAKHASRFTELVNNDLGVPASSSSPLTNSAIVGVNTSMTPNCTGIVAERPIYVSNFVLTSGTVSSGSDVVGFTKTGTTFYFADVPTGTNDSSFITILAPSTNNTSANITASFYTGGQVLPNSLTTSVAPGTRGTMLLNNTGSIQHAAVKITSDQPIMVERPNYFDDLSEGNAGRVSGASSVIPVQATADDWLFAEGYTGAGFQEDLVLANFGTATAIANVMLEFTNGHTEIVQVMVNSQDSTFVDVNAILASNAGSCDTTPCQPTSSVSAEITTSNGQNIVAEREIFFHYNHRGNGRLLVVTGGTDVMGQVGPAASTAFFAEGYTNTNYDEWLTLQNPTTNTETITVSLVNGDGTSYTLPVTVMAHSRYTIDIVAQVLQHLIHPHDTYLGYEVSMVVSSSSGPFVAERPMYWHTGSTQGGSDALGYRGG